jgi:hypothetical protein
MLCPVCNADNPPAAVKCGACGEPFKRKRRPRDAADDSQTPFAAQADSRDRIALTAYRCAVFGLIPFAGLVLGPAAVILGLVARRRLKAGAAARGKGAAKGAIVLGSVVLLTNWVGLILMVIGLRS